MMGVAADGDDLEIAVWAPSDHSRGAGYYGCFRLFVEDGVATGATLFCFYDGTESSPGIASIQEARAYARSNGFMKENKNED